MIDLRATADALEALCDAAEQDHAGKHDGSGHEHDASCPRCSARASLLRLGFAITQEGRVAARALAEAVRALADIGDQCTSEEVSAPVACVAIAGLVDEALAVVERVAQAMAKETKG